MLYVGTSGFAYKEWKPSFYPEDVAAKAFLEYYASQFTSVEVNNSFYQMPKAELFTDWAARVPDGFRFSVKMNRRVTHVGRLLNIEEPTRVFFERVTSLGDKLGPVLVQLPPNAQKNIERLRAFLPLTAGTRCAFEFRHKSWFADDVYEALGAHDQSLCIAEAEDLTTPWVRTASWGYARLRELAYTDSELGERRKRIDDAKWQDTYVYFKHEDEGVGPKLARRFLAL